MQRSGNETSAPTPTRSYFVAVGITGVMTCLRWLLDPLLEGSHPFFLFLFGVFVSAWLCGWKPAILSLVLGLSIACYYFVAPRFDFRIESTGDRVGFVAYVVTAAMGIALAETSRTAHQRSEAYARKMELEVAKRQEAEEESRNIAEIITSSLDATIAISLEGLSPLGTLPHSGFTVR